MDNPLSLPAWSRADPGARYRATIMGKPVALHSAGAAMRAEALPGRPHPAGQ